MARPIVPLPFRGLPWALAGALLTGCAQLPEPPQGQGLDGAFERIQAAQLDRAIDAPAVDIRIRRPAGEPVRAADGFDLTVTVTPRVPVESMDVSVSLAGGIEAGAPAGFQALDPIEPYIRGLAGSSHFRSRVQAVAPAKPVSFTLPVTVTRAGRGYVLVSARSPAGAGPVAAGEASVLFLLATPEQVFFSEHSFLDTEVQQLRSAGARRGDSPQAVEKAVRRLKRRGAVVRKRIVSGPPTPRRASRALPYRP